jgi:UDP-glucose 4-epimerase
MSNINKVLITGSLGHIGSGLLKYFEKYSRNLELVITDNLLTQRFSSLFNLPTNVVYFHQIDTRDSVIEKLVEDSDLVIHLSAVTDATSSIDNPKGVFENNLESTRHIVEICGKLEKYLIFPSSTSVYGKQEFQVDENCLDLKPQSPYAECKLEEENLILKYKHPKFIVLRLGTIHGVSPGMRFHTAVNKFCFQAAYGQKISIWKSAYDQVRPYLGTQDLYHNLNTLLASPSLIENNQLLNVVSSNSTPRIITEIIKENIEGVQLEFVEEPIMNQFSYEVLNNKSLEVGFSYSNRIKLDIEETLDLLRIKHEA